MFLWLFNPSAGLDLCASSTSYKHFLLTPIRGSHKSKGALKTSYHPVITKMCFKRLNCFKLETRLCLIKVLRNVQLPAGKQ